MIEGVVLGLGGLYLLILTLRAAGALVVRRGPVPRGTASPTITIVQPILSGDPALEATLKANLGALGHVAFLWAVDEADAEALRLSEELKAAHPEVSLTIHRFPPPPDGVNPKTFKLAGVWSQITTEVAVILDDDTILGAADLEVLVAGLDRGDLATVLPQARPGGSGPSRLLGQFVDNNAVLTYLAPLVVMEPLTINGMGWAVRTASWAHWGGWDPLLRHLTDDWAVAHQIRRGGGNLVQTLARARVGTTLPNWAAYFRQMHRWFFFARLLLVEEPLGRRLGLALVQGLPPLVLLALLVLSAFEMAAGAGPGAFLVAGVVGLLRAGVLIALQGACTGRVGYRPGLSELSELLQTLHLGHALTVRTIRWRNRHYFVSRNDAFLAR